MLSSGEFSVVSKFTSYDWLTPECRALPPDGTFVAETVRI